MVDREWVRVSDVVDRSLREYAVELGLEIPDDDLGFLGDHVTDDIVSTFFTTPRRPEPPKADRDSWVRFTLAGQPRRPFDRSPPTPHLAWSSAFCCSP